MAADETELSFIRCPNCRSLVPAVATRCRMCGFILKGAEEVPAEDRPSRVRQRTITVSPEELPASEPKEFLPSEVEEIEGEPFEELHQVDEFADYPEDDAEEEEAESESAVVGTVLPSPKRKRRRRKKKRYQADAGPMQPQLQEQSKRHPGQEMGDNDVVAPWRSAEPRAGFRLREERVDPVLAEAEQEVSSSQPEPRAEAPLPSEPALEGELAGWLVSFMEDKKGVSREVRVGKFFVGAKQLRPSDFVIDDQSVSTPQCLVVCDPVRGISIQDLMSEQGTFVKRAGTGSYERHSEQVQLKHGDFIRFGRYEMLFVALPR